MLSSRLVQAESQLPDLAGSPSPTGEPAIGFRCWGIPQNTAPSATALSIELRMLSPEFPEFRPSPQTTRLRRQICQVQHSLQSLGSNDTSDFYWGLAW